MGSRLPTPAGALLAVTASRLSGLSGARPHSLFHGDSAAARGCAAVRAVRAQPSRRGRHRVRFSSLAARRYHRHDRGADARLLRRHQHDERRSQESAASGRRRFAGCSSMRPRPSPASPRPGFFICAATRFGIALALFAGFFFYIGASDLIPESYHAHPKLLTTVMTLAGAAVFISPCHSSAEAALQGLSPRTAAVPLVAALPAEAGMMLAIAAHWIGARRLMQEAPPGQRAERGLARSSVHRRCAWGSASSRYISSEYGSALESTATPHAAAQHRRVEERPLPPAAKPIGAITTAPITVPSAGAHAAVRGARLLPEHDVKRPAAAGGEREGDAGRRHRPVHGPNGSSAISPSAASATQTIIDGAMRGRDRNRQRARELQRDRDAERNAGQAPSRSKNSCTPMARRK